MKYNIRHILLYETCIENSEIKKSIHLAQDIYYYTVVHTNKMISRYGKAQLYKQRRNIYKIEFRIPLII